MSELTPAERRALRARAHHLHPVVSIGQHGLTPQVAHEIDVALTAHGLVKVRVHSDDRAAREALLATICAQVGAAPVQHLGKILLLWRARDEDDAPDAAAAPRAAAGGARTAPSQASPRRRRAGAAHGGSGQRKTAAATTIPRKAHATGYLTRGDAKAGRPPRPASAPRARGPAAGGAKAAPSQRRRGTTATATATATPAARPPKPLPRRPRGSQSRRKTRGT